MSVIVSKADLLCVHPELPLSSYLGIKLQYQINLALADSNTKFIECCHALLFYQSRAWIG